MSHAGGSDLFIGLMSGTSMDGLDAVLAAIAPMSQVQPSRSPIQVRAHAHVALPADLRAELLALNFSGSNELHRAALAANALAWLQADLVELVLGQAGVNAAEVCAVGSHGQTVRHRPGEFDGLGYTLQLNNGALLADLCGIDVVCDFRSRDVAAGGQGAPLVPAFHALVFGPALGQAPRAVLNIGGMANLSLLPALGAHGDSAGAGVRGFDCGPGNALIDGWITRHQGLVWDENGQWAASGTVDTGLLTQLLAEPFLSASLPKSTGRDLFNTTWLDAHLKSRPAISAVNVQATLAEFSARAAADALNAHAPDTEELLVCGGGALNADLMRRLARLLPGVRVLSSSAAGVPPMQVEAAAFAWLASAFVRREPGNLPTVTGARGLRVLGALYPAG